MTSSLRRREREREREILESFPTFKARSAKKMYVYSDARLNERLNKNSMKDRTAKTPWRRQGSPRPGILFTATRAQGLRLHHRSFPTPCIRGGLPIRPELAYWRPPNTARLSSRTQPTNAMNMVISIIYPTG